MKATKEMLGESMMTSAVGVLGAMLIDEKAVGPMLMAVSESDFRATEQKNVFRAIRELYGEGAHVDPILVNERLGGKYNAYLAGLIDATPTAANADAYAKELKRTSRLWQLREIGEAVMNADSEEDAQELIDKASLLFCQRQDVKRLTMEQGFREFWERHSGERKGKNRLSWGFPALDRLINVTTRDMVVIGGRPSAGKTALALQLGFHIAKTKSVGFYSYETDNETLYDRTVSTQTATSFKRILQDDLDTVDYGRIRTCRELLVAPRMEYIDAHGMTVNDIRVDSMAHHYDVVIVDYLQKIFVPKVRDSFQRVTMASDDLQQMARSTRKTVIALSQLKRVNDETAPTMSDLRESGQIEQDADVIMLLYKEDPKDKRSRRVLDIAKNRNGEPDRGMLLNFDGDRQFFSPVKKEPEERPEPKKREGPSQTELYYKNLAQQAQGMGGEPK